MKSSNPVQATEIVTPDFVSILPEQISRKTEKFYFASSRHLQEEGSAGETIMLQKTQPLISVVNRQYLHYQSICKGMNDYDWASDKCNLVNQMTPITLWFMVCGQYFQKDFNSQLQLQSLHTLLLKEVVHRDRCYDYEDDQLIIEVLRMGQRKIDLDELSTVYQNLLLQQKKKNSLAIQNLEQQQLCTNQILEMPLQDSLLQDLCFIKMDEKEYLDRMEAFIQNQGINPPDEDNINEYSGRQTKKLRVSGYTYHSEDQDMAVCHVCNDGDYQDDNLIVFCSKCNISVHQRCYVINEIPQGDWICDVCMNFGENGQYLRCPLCSQLGGAMKETSADISVFQSSNTEYYWNVSKTKTPKPTTLDFNYNFLDAYQNTLKLFDDPYIALKEPHPQKVWAHLSCIFWTPECYIDDRDALKGIETVDKKRFYLQCSVCGQRRQGACVQCSRGQCQIAFHPECARRANKLMSIQLSSANKTEYTLYCEKHTPFKLKRIIETKHRQYEREIIDFFKSFERFKSQVNKQTKKRIEQKIIKKQLKKFQKQNKRKNRMANPYFIKFSDDELHSFAIQFKFYIDNIVGGISIDMTSEGNLYTVTSINIPDIYPLIPEYQLRIIPDFVKPQSELERSVLPFFLGNIPEDDIIWCKFQFKFYDREQLFRIYKRTTFTAKKVYLYVHYQIMHRFTKKNQNPKPLYLLTNAKYKKEVKVLEKLEVTNIQLDGGDYEVIDKNPYCICREKFQDHCPMIQCEICDEWYHNDCLGVKKSAFQLDDEGFEFYCFMCEENLDPIKKKKIRNLNKKVFDDPFFPIQRQIAKQMNFQLIRDENLRLKEQKLEKIKEETKNQEQNEQINYLDEQNKAIKEQKNEYLNEQIGEQQNEQLNQYLLIDENQFQINENQFQIKENLQQNEKFSEEIMAEEQLQQQPNQQQDKQPLQLDVIAQVCEIREVIQQEEIKKDLQEIIQEQEINLQHEIVGQMKESNQKGSSNLKQSKLEQFYKLKQ